MTKNEIEIMCDEDQLIEYYGNIYEFVGLLGNHYVFSNTGNGDTLCLKENTLLQDYVYFVDRQDYEKFRAEYLASLEDN